MLLILKSFFLITMFELKFNKGWFWLENKLTENQWKIAETIYTPLQIGHFFSCSDHILQLLDFFHTKIAEICLLTGKKNHPCLL
jgi:hypothetical protein